MKQISDHFERILVPVDFESAGDEAIEKGKALRVGEHDVVFAPASIQAVRLGAALARASRGRLTLLHATPPMQVGSMYTGPVSIPSQVLDEIHQKAAATSSAALDMIRLAEADDLQVTIAVRPGGPVKTILDESKRLNADLVVMAASGRSRVARFFVGSTADRVIREAGCPVLVVPTE